MAKGKTATVFFCQNCGYESTKWLGQCPGCREWNTFVEETIDKTVLKNTGTGSRRERREASEPCVLSEIAIREENKTLTGIKELDRVLGGGIVQGSLTLVGGDPGIGKSTLLLQVCHNLSEAGHKVLYISGEESKVQIKMRADRLGTFSEHMLLLCETNLDIIGEVIRRSKPEVVIIDSIQTMYNENVSAAPGSVSQVRESTGILLQLAKGLGISIFIVGHVTKEGNIAGPRVLEHMVDTVLYLEGERYNTYRILRAVKNRFGSTNEIGMFEMRQEGMCEVTNPSDILITEREDNPSGSCIIASIEGTRPILVEMQALTSQSVFGIPKRTANGFDYNRLAVLIAVLEKRAGLALGGQDIYLNIAGGMKLNEPAVDLGIIATVASAYKNIPIPQSTVVMGEVGLTGEVRRINLIEKRLKEAEKLGFKTCIIPENNKKSLKDEYKLDIIGVKNIGEALRKLGIK
mgnify:CR=1 FL=1